MAAPLCLTARWVLPIDSEPIERGEVEVRGDALAYVGAMRPAQMRPADCAVRNFGEAALLPGLVNAHTHLEYTLLRGFLEDVEFFPWIRGLMAAKARYSEADWLLSARLGAAECIRAGITTIGDNTDAGVTAQAALETGLRARIYQELFGIDEREASGPVVDDLDSKLQRLSAFASERVELGISPHALYTISPELFQAIERYRSANGDLRTSIHVAESSAESRLTERGDGPFAEMFARRGIAWQCPHVTPTRYLYDLGAFGPHALAVHCVHQTEEDISLIERSGAGIAHCPKSNAKLGAGIAPLAGWLARPSVAGRVALGTDSVVSNNAHDLFEEMRFGLLMQRGKLKEVALSARQMVSAATLGGSTALGWSDRIGSLTVGKKADLIAVRLDTLHSAPVTDPYAALVYSARAEDVCLSMVNGRILYDGLTPDANGEFECEQSKLLQDAAALRVRLAAQ